MGECCEADPLFQEFTRRGGHHACFDAGPDGACAECHVLIFSILSEAEERAITAAIEHRP